VKGKASRGLQISDLLLDVRNVQILALLGDDPRTSVSELARCVGMSAPAIRERIQRMEEAGIIQGYQVVECHRITGEDCFIMKVGLDSLDNLDLILDQFLAYGQTTTSIVQSTPVPARHLPLPGKR
jgi:Lrp/AsnC family leucine-responsive transcriptional regulator